MAGLLPLISDGRDLLHDRRHALLLTDVGVIPGARVQSGITWCETHGALHTVQLGQLSLLQNHTHSPGMPVTNCFSVLAWPCQAVCHCSFTISGDSFLFKTHEMVLLWMSR